MNKKKDKREIYLVQESAFWSEIQESVHNAVVQVVAQVGQFDWCEPYRIEDQYENYGSGFLINSQGYIITNLHVIENAKHIWVHVPALGRKQLDAQVISICPDRDLALLRISHNNIRLMKKKMGTIPFLVVGDSDDVQRADNVLVLGYPLGQHHLKSTTGIVSGREFIFGTSLLQVTAPINPGNSGGPLFNIVGHVIGIAVAVVSSAQNVGYAIPINELKIIIKDMYSNSIVRKPFLGARFIDAVDEKATLLHNPSPPGWYIVTVFKGTLLDRAGVLSGDMLYVFNGYQLDPYGETTVPWASDKVSVYDLISRVKIGDTIKLVMYRNGKRKDITITVEALDPFAIRQRFPGYEAIHYEVIGGMVIMELATNHLEELMDSAPELVRFNYPEYRLDPVLIITHILPGSYTHQLRTLKAGDIINTVNGIVVSTLHEWRTAVRKSIETGLLSITTTAHILVVFSLKEILYDEKRLSQAFAYPISEMVKKLQHVVLEKKEKRKQHGKNKKTA